MTPVYIKAIKAIKWTIGLFLMPLIIQISGGILVILYFTLKQKGIL